MISIEHNPFWRDTALDHKEMALFCAVQDAHYQSTFRDNLSTTAVKLAAYGSGDYTKALAAALSTLGGVHAPLVQTHQFLSCDDPPMAARHALDNGVRIPGWGSSFSKGAPDPLWEKVAALLKEHWLPMYEKIDMVTAVLRMAGKDIHPNPSAYTAATAIILGMRADLAPYLFVAGRLQGWSEVFAFSGI